MKTNTPIPIYIDGVLSARALVTESISASVNDPRRNEDYDCGFWGNILFFGEFQNLSDTVHHGIVLRKPASVDEAVRTLKRCRSIYILLRAEKIPGQVGRQAVTIVDSVDEANGIMYCMKAPSNECPLFEDDWEDVATITLDAEFKSFAMFHRGQVYDVEVERWCGGTADEAAEHLKDGKGYKNLYDEYYFNLILIQPGKRRILT